MKICGSIFQVFVGLFTLMFKMQISCFWEHYLTVGCCFVSSDFSQMLPPAAALLSTLDELHTLSMRMFFASLTYSTNKLLEKVDFPQML